MKIIIFLIGIIIGVLSMLLYEYMYKEYQATIEIDKTQEPNKYLFVWHLPLDEIEKHKSINVRIKDVTDIIIEKAKQIDETQN